MKLILLCIIYFFIIGCSHRLPKDIPSTKYEYYLVDPTEKDTDMPFGTNETINFKEDGSFHYTETGHMGIILKTFYGWWKIRKNYIILSKDLSRPKPFNNTKDSLMGVEKMYIDSLEKGKRQILVYDLLLDNLVPNQYDITKGPFDTTYMIGSKIKTKDLVQMLFFEPPLIDITESEITIMDYFSGEISYLFDKNDKNNLYKFYVTYRVDDTPGELLQTFSIKKLRPEGNRLYIDEKRHFQREYPSRK